jgi:hypothetical protein
MFGAVLAALCALRRDRALRLRKWVAQPSVETYGVCALLIDDGECVPVPFTHIPDAMCFNHVDADAFLQKMEALQSEYEVKGMQPGRSGGGEYFDKWTVTLRRL